ncbi:hypothetical protein LCGC14_2058270 [marine sediment metagenome]|uniref:phenylalanine--tRNA ligase n=1 Tax=marine sediment metagenome TaxID=412755 RepID=A0A0F9H0E9_9ZZZZ
MADDQSPLGYERDSLGSSPQDAKPPTKEEQVEIERKGAIVSEVKDHYSLVLLVEHDQRRREKDDLYFEGVDQWPQEQQDTRKEHVDSETGDTIAGRPIIQVNLLDQPLQQIATEARQARLAITVKPKSGRANTKTSAQFKGLIRSIQADSNAPEARLWGLDRAAKAGRGNYRIETVFANDGDWDQDIVIERILDQDQVYFDLHSQRADRSDAEWAIETVWMSESERERRWPGIPVAADDSAFQEDAPRGAWYSLMSKTKQRGVLVARYYRVVHSPRTRAHHASTGIRWLDEMPKEIQAMAARREPSVRLREVDQRRIERYFVDGDNVLEELPWDGRYIPIIPVIGKEYLVRGERIWKGVVANAKGISHAINLLLSNIIELVAQMPRMPYLIPFGADEGLEEWWDQIFTKSFTRVPYHPKTIDGKPAGPPTRQNLEPPIQGLMFLARMLQDTFYFSDEVLLRTHTSPMQIRAMEEQGPPIYIVVPGKVYRRDSDATHTPMFNQIEGLAVDEGITLADLQGTLLEFARAIFGAERQVRLRPHYFPFTEPSVEVDVSCFSCGGSGRLADGSRDPLCKGIGWIEIAGAGMVDPNVFGFVEKSGYEHDRVQGFAFGLGIDRIAMLKHALPDLRLLFENDLRFLEQF